MKGPMPLILGGAALLLLTRKSAGTAIPPAVKGGRKQLRCAFGATGLGDDWLRFLETTARRESNFNNLATNDRASEAASARVSAERRWNALSKYGYSLDDWSFGSGGWFQFLPAAAVLSGGGPRFPDAFIKKYGPDIVYRMGPSMASAISYARGLIVNWKNFAGTWASLDVGWDNPSQMGNPAKLGPGRIKNMEDRAAKLGWGRGWAHQMVSIPPSRSREEYQAMAEAAQRAAEAC